MNKHTNPYYRPQGLMSLKISNFIKGDIDFKYMFYGNQMRGQNEPMFKWLVDTRKVLTVNTADKDWSFIKNKRRDKSWIGDNFSYWPSPARYFIIGYAIEACKGIGANLSVNLDDLVELFSNEDKHQELINNFIKDFFYDASIDIFSVKACKNSSLIEYKTLKSCFENGYRLCSDLYLALDQAKKMGPVGSFMKLSNICLALGFDELPLWYIQESSEHRLNSDINNDIEKQKNLAVWAFLRVDNNSIMVAQNDPYGVKEVKNNYGSSGSSGVESISLRSSKPEKNKQSSKRRSQQEVNDLTFLENDELFESSELNINDSESMSIADNNLALDTADTDIQPKPSENDVVKNEVEKPRAKKKSDRLLSMF